jgi:transposase
MVKAIEDLFKDRTRTTNRIEALKQYPEEYNKIPLKSLKKMVRKIDKEIKSIEKEIMKIIEKYEYKEQYKRLTSIPGIGERTAASLIAYFNEFETFKSPKEVVSYVGLTPSIDESGESVKKKGYKISKMGNPYIRQMLFMASLSASRYNNQCNTLYERLLNKGKDKKVILMAVANKLIRQAFAIVKFKREYNPLYGIKEGETTTQ